MVGEDQGPVLPSPDQSRWLHRATAGIWIFGRGRQHTRRIVKRGGQIYKIYHILYLLAKAVNESFHNIHNLTFLDIYLLKSKCYMPKVMIGRNFLSFIELCTCTDRSHTSHTWDPKKVISEELNLIPWTPVETFCWQIGCRNICSILSGDNSPQLWGVVLC